MPMVQADPAQLLLKRHFTVVFAAATKMHPITEIKTISLNLQDYYVHCKKTLFMVKTQYRAYQVKLPPLPHPCKLPP